MQYFRQVLAATGIAVLTLLVAAPSVEAQLFGTRPATGQAVLKGNERYLRGNRSKREFVGVAAANQAKFIGAQQAIASGRVRSATEGLKIPVDDSKRLNRPLPPQPSKGLYYPKLELDLATSAGTNAKAIQRDLKVDQRWQQRIQSVAGNSVRMTVDNSIATIEGSVDNVRTAELVVQMLQFEPGIDEVRNQLTVLER